MYFSILLPLNKFWLRYCPDESNTDYYEKNYKFVQISLFIYKSLLVVMCYLTAHALRFQGVQTPVQYATYKVPICDPLVFVLRCKKNFFETMFIYC